MVNLIKYPSLELCSCSCVTFSLSPFTFLNSLINEIMKISKELHTCGTLKMLV